MNTFFRSDTRKQRYARKKRQAQTLNVSLTTINFLCDNNLAFLIRAAACMCASHVNVIGGIPDRKHLYNASGSLVDMIEIRQFKSVNEFLNQLDEKIVAAELCDNATSIYDYKFDFSVKTTIVVGNEQTGVPSELILYGDPIFIPMNGIGYCLNTSQTANIMLYEYNRQFGDVAQR